MNIVIVGRPNVGKSTLFNRLSRVKDKKGRSTDGGAIVADFAGTTRDRREAFGYINSYERKGKFRLIDTAGLELKTHDSMEKLMIAQTEIAIEEADILLFVYDAKEGLTAVDEDFARRFRKKNIPLLLVANKCDGRADRLDIESAYRLGFGEPIQVSSEHGTGYADLVESIEAAAKEREIFFIEDEGKEKEMQIAIVGRPNVGKSTMFNALLNEERSIVADFHGTTRDSVYVDWEYRGVKIQLVDTAGIRKKAKTGDQLEHLSIEDSYKAVQYASICVILIDASEISVANGIDRQDLALADHILEEGRGLVIAFNKWDKVEDEDQVRELIKYHLEKSLSQAKNIPVIFMSAITAENTNRAINKALIINGQWNKRITTGQLNRWLDYATERHLPPLSGGQRIRFKFATQVKSRPPTFAIFTSSNLKELPRSYSRYLINSLAEEFAFEGVPIRLHLRKQNNPYGNK